jgi:prepilin-type N-terminal cleavage/methylation domain-containing protein
MKSTRPPSGSIVSGFTLLELLCVLAVLSILLTLGAPLAGHFRSRVRGQQCVSNLKGLGVHTASYLADHNNVWPQIKPAAPDGSNNSRQDEATAELWIAALSPYGASDKIWRCPSIEAKIKANGTPGGLTKKRLDYIPTQFNAEPGAATQWPTHPWFIERTPNHGLGPYILQADGNVFSMEELLNKIR